MDAVFNCTLHNTEQLDGRYSLLAVFLCSKNLRPDLCMGTLAASRFVLLNSRSLKLAPSHATPAPSVNDTPIRFCFLHGVGVERVEVVKNQSDDG